MIDLDMPGRACGEERQPQLAKRSPNQRLRRRADCPRLHGAGHEQRQQCLAVCPSCVTERAQQQQQ
jgi:hypothetical protein